MEVCACVLGAGDDFSHSQWTMTREEEKVFLQCSRFLKLRFVTPTYIGHHIFSKTKSTWLGALYTAKIPQTLFICKS